MFIQSVILEKGVYDSYSYENIFDAGHFMSLTGISDYFLNFRYKGSAKISLYRGIKGEEKCVTNITLSGNRWREKKISLPKVTGKDKFWFSVDDTKNFAVEDIIYGTDAPPEALGTDCETKPESNDKLLLGLVICLYDGRQQLKNNLDLLKDSYFFKKDDSKLHREFFRKLRVVIVDNKNKSRQISTKGITIIHNGNEGGGTGGFDRGLQEFVMRAEDEKPGYVVFMDDDVDIAAECLYRLYALLRNLKNEHKDRPVAGRMFDISSPSMQYTAVEEWNRGFVRHVGHHIDMNDKRNLVDLNEAESGQYGGWWFCCYPFSFAGDNRPLPFFLHCDDVEYGLRCGKKPIVLNGIHVHHEIPEKKANPALAYYDARNTMIVNAVYGLSTVREMLDQWENRLAAFRDKEDYESVLMTLLAMIHFLRGAGWFEELDGKRNHIRLQKKSFPEYRWLASMMKLSYKLCWRALELYAKLRLDTSIISYRMRFLGANHHENENL